MQNVQKWLAATLDRRRLLKFCLICGMIVGLFAHGFMFANKIPNHDDLQWYSDFSQDALILGRYVLFFFWKLFSDLSTPWFNGIFGILFLSLASFVLCDAFEVRKAWRALGVVCIMLTFPVNASIFGFMFEAHLKMLGILFACCVPWAIVKLRGGWLWAAGFAFLATGIYQVYIMLSIGLLILLVMRNTIRSALEGEAGGRVWAFAVACAAAAVAGLALYLAGNWLMTTLGGVEMRSYQGLDQMGAMDLTMLPQKILTAYQTVWDYFFADMPAYTTKLMQVAQWVLLCAAAAAILVALIFCIRKKRFVQMALLAVCVALLPLAAAGIYFMGDEIDAHQITLYPLIVILLLPMLCMDGFTAGLPSLPALRRICALAMVMACLMYGFCFSMLSNQAYYRMHMAFTRAENFGNRLAARIESMEGYHSGMRLVTRGYLSHEEPLMYFEYDIASRFLPFLGVRNEFDYYWDDTALWMLTRIVGLPMVPDHDWQPETEQERELVENMPCYPAEGSIVFVGDVCVIRFS